MTTEVVTATEGVVLEEANAVLKASKKGKLPVVDAEGNVSTVQLSETCFGGTQHRARRLNIDSITRFVSTALICLGDTSII